MLTKRYEAEYTYDYDLDVVNIEIKQDYIHKKSIDLDVGVFLDFDDNCMPVNLEIVSASKIVDVEKDLLVNPDGDVVIVIDDNLIEVEVIFRFKNDEESIQITTLNDLGFPNSQTNFALV